MLNEQFMMDIPDEPPEDLVKAVEQGIEGAADILGLHKHLTTQLRQLQKLRVEAATKHGVALNPADAPVVRLNLLVKHGMGTLTDLRLKMELEWVKIGIDSLQAGIQQVDDAKKAHKLHLPGGGVLDVPAQEENNGRDSTS